MTDDELAAEILGTSGANRHRWSSLDRWEAANPEDAARFQQIVRVWLGLMDGPDPPGWVTLERICKDRIPGFSFQRQLLVRVLSERIQRL